MAAADCVVVGGTLRDIGAKGCIVGAEDVEDRGTKLRVLPMAEAGAKLML